MKTRIISNLLIVVSLISLSCSEDGPAGPSGPAGAAGVPGPTGATGATGATGTANVIYGEWFTPATYETTTIFGTKHFAHTVTVPEFTQEVLDSGAVLVYAKLHGYNPLIWPRDQVGQLPITVTYLNGAVSVYDTWSAFAAVGTLKIDFVNSDNIYANISNAHQFRYIVIPGGVAASAGGRVAPSDEALARLRAMSYEEAMAVLGIPE